MTQRTRLIVTSLVAALPVALGLYAWTGWLRGRDEVAALDRTVRLFTTIGARAQCQADPTSFPVSALPPQPAASPQDQTGDVPPPRAPMLEAHPFELFVYDEQFRGEHPAAPRFPADFRRALLTGSTEVSGTWSNEVGTSHQLAILTGWNGDCNVLLVRFRPVPTGWAHAGLFAGLYGIVAVVLLAAGVPIVLRLEKLAGAARRSTRQDYAEMLPVGGRDEIGSVAFAFNEAAADIRRRAADVRDREDALQRFVVSAAQDTAAPLADAQAQLAALLRSPSLDDAARVQARTAAADAHEVAALLGNLEASARLRVSAEGQPHHTVDLAAVVRRVVEAHRPAAEAAGVSLAAAVPDRAETTVSVSDPALLDRAVANLIDNAIQYNQAGGHVHVSLERNDAERHFWLRVADDGMGVPEAELKRLAVRRFRTEGARARRPKAPGLGLDIVREVAERSGLLLAFRRSTGGGLEVDLSGPTAQ